MTRGVTATVSGTVGGGSSDRDDPIRPFERREQPGVRGVLKPAREMRVLMWVSWDPPWCDPPCRARSAPGSDGPGRMVDEGVRDRGRARPRVFMAEGGCGVSRARGSRR